MLKYMLKQVFSYSLPLFLGVGFLLMIKWYNSKSSNSSKKLPPSPPRLPIIGNLHQLKGNIHEAFLSLTKRYGDSHDLLLLYIGMVPSLIVSTTEGAREIMKTHDLAFADRPTTRMYRALSYNLKDATIAPYGEHWKQAKGLLTQHLLSTKSVQSFEGMREKVIAEYVSKLNQCFLSNKPADLTDLFVSMVNDLTSMATFGKTYNEENKIGMQFKNIVKDVSEILGEFYFEDSIPQLAFVDSLRGVRAKIDRVVLALDEFLQGVVDEAISRTSNKLNPVREDGCKPFVEVLLNMIHEDNDPGFTMDADFMKSLLLDAYIAATDTTSSILQWTMTEFLKNPDIMKKAQDEVRTVLNGKKDITSNDLEKMTYLKAVIMESTRLHPPVPILLPRVARYDVNVMGYDIAKGTRVYVNVYAIMKDPKVWDKPEMFVPERFLESSIDLVNHNFELLPFGAGRRICPGRIYAIAIDEMVLATLLYKFDWSLPQGIRPEDIDMNGAIGFANHKKLPLLAVGKPVTIGGN